MWHDNSWKGGQCHCPERKKGKIIIAFGKLTDFLKRLYCHI